MIKIVSKTNFKTKAQAMVEFALALPILMLLIIGVLEAGRLMFIYGSVTTAAREAVRYASAVGVNDSGVQRFRDCPGIEAAAKKVGFLQPIEEIHITYDRGVLIDGTPKPIAGIDPTPGSDSCPIDSSLLKNGDRVVTQVSLLYEPILQFTPLEPFVITSTSARTVIVNVAIEVTAPPQSWNPNATDTPTPSFTPTPTNTDTPTPSNTPTETMTSTMTNTPTDTATPTATLLYTYTPSQTPTPSRTPTSTPLPSCSEIVIDRARYNFDGFEARVLNNSLSTAYLVHSTLVWDLNYAPPMYLNYFSFNSVQYFDTNTYTSPVSSAAPSIELTGNGTQAMWIANFDNQTFVGAYSVTLTFAFPGWGSCVVSSGIYNSSPTPSFTPSPTATAVNCMLVTGGTLGYDDNRMYMDITNNTGATLNTTQVTVTWNNNDGSNGNDKTLRLRQITLNGTTWLGDISYPSYTVVPYYATIPTGTTRITFTFHQDYKKQDGTEKVVIMLSNNGCTNYSISNR